jgi:hypothetical protein
MGSAKRRREKRRSGESDDRPRSTPRTAASGSLDGRTMHPWDDVIEDAKSRMTRERPAPIRSDMDDERIAVYRQRHPLGTMARLAIELTLNVAARHHDIHLIGRQHLRDGFLTWRPHKTRRTTNKVLTVRVMPELAAALDAMPRTGDHSNRPHPSAARLPSGASRLVSSQRLATMARRAVIASTVCARPPAHKWRNVDAPRRKSWR